MNCMNYDHNKKFGLSKFHSGYWTFYLNSPKGYSQKIISAQTDFDYVIKFFPQEDCWKMSGEANKYLIWTLQHSTIQLN